MRNQTRLRIKANPQALVKLAGLASNALSLSVNAYLLGTNISKQIREKRSETIANKLQLTADIASAVAGLAKVIVTTLDGKHESNYDL